MLPLWAQNMYRILARTKCYYALCEGTQTDTIIDNYDAIHFHDCFSLYGCRKKLENYQGKVILTIHTPKPPFLEYKEDLFTPLEKCLLPNHIKMYETMTEYSFDRADYIIFPSPYAEESYYELWSRYKNIKLRNSEKYHYLYTGVKQCYAKKTRNAVREQYGIPDNAFVLSFVGRHNEVKGYDRLINIVQTLWDEAYDIYCLNAGYEGPLLGVHDKRWKEVGWTNDPYSIVKAADVFILPNRQTYFDLVLLEMLSLGQVIVASNTGGNKEFIKKEGVLLFESNDDAVAVLKRVMSMSFQERKRMQDANKMLFDAQFNNDTFKTAYCNLLQQILSY